MTTQKKIIAGVIILAVVIILGWMSRKEAVPGKSAEELRQEAVMSLETNTVVTEDGREEEVKSLKTNQTLTEEEKRKMVESL